jgi:osmotically-inducible protein OsmY
MKIKNASLNYVLCLGLLTSTATIVWTGCAGNEYKRSTGEYIDDKSLDARVRSALDDSDYKFSDVNVDAFKGKVQLNGFVNTSDQKSQAEKIAKNVAGVQDVVNNITVKQ